MQDLPPYPSSWASLAWLLVATFLGGGGIAGAGIKLYGVYVAHRKHPIDIHVSRAQALKDEAEAEKIDVQADVARFDLVARMMGRLDETHESIDKLRRECHSLRDTVRNQQVELELADYQLQRMYGFIKSKGLHYADADKKD